jgi:tripartite-type tricarboxylate transporter receptor subunit TctC
MTTMTWMLRALGGLFALLALLTIVGPGAAVAQSPSYPDRPIRVVVPWPPGGTTDLLARLLAQSLTRSLRQTVIVENLAGASGNVGTRRFVSATPDGYTLLLASSTSNAANPYLFKELGFDPIKDFTPIALIARVPNVLVVNNASPLTSIEGLIAAAKAKPGALSYGSSGVGSSANLAGEMFKSVAKIDVLHVPYKGVAPALLGLLGGEVSYSFTTGIDGNIEGKKLRPLAITAARRAQALPDVPTFTELGFSEMKIDTWFSLAGPAGLPADLVRTLNSAVVSALAENDLKNQLLRLGSDLYAYTPEQFADFWVSEVKRYADVVRLSGATPE